MWQRIDHHLGRPRTAAVARRSHAAVGKIDRRLVFYRSRTPGMRLEPIAVSSPWRYYPCTRLWLQRLPPRLPLASDTAAGRMHHIMHPAGAVLRWSVDPGPNISTSKPARHGISLRWSASINLLDLHAPSDRSNLSAGRRCFFSSFPRHSYAAGILMPPALLWRRHSCGAGTPVPPALLCRRFSVGTVFGCPSA